MTIITEFSAQNFMRIKAIRIVPDGNTVVLTGENGAGKTSVLEAIAAAIEGKGALPADPIRDREDKAWIKLTLDDGKVVKRTISRGKDGKPFTTSLTVEGVGSSPQKVLDSWITNISFDPVAFLGLPAKDQVSALRRFVPGVDFEAIEQEIAAKFAERTDIGRERDRAAAAAAAIVVADNLPERPVNEAGLVEAMARAAETNSQIAEEAARRAEQERLIVSLDTQLRADDEAIMRAHAEIEALNRKIECMREAKSAKANRIVEISDDLAAAPPLPARVDASDLQEKITTARRTNEQIRQRDARDNMRMEAVRLGFVYGDLTDEIDRQREAVRQAIAQAAMPVPGLGFADDGAGITLNGHPFAQASAGERLRTAVAIGMASNPTLRVLRMDGSTLSEKNLRLVADMAAAEGYQVWIERPSVSGMASVMIEDGELAQVQGEAA